MPNRIFCQACGAPLSGVGAACKACGAGAAAPAYSAATPVYGAAAGTPAYDWTRNAYTAPSRPRSTFKATVLGAVPGLGHLYAGHRVKAVAIFCGFVAAVVVGTDLDMTMVGAVAGVPIDAGGLGLWLFSMWDAYWTVHQDNRVVQAAASSTPSLR
jgi:hypothetical protein